MDEPLVFAGGPAHGEFAQLGPFEGTVVVFDVCLPYVYRRTTYWPGVPFLPLDIMLGQSPQASRLIPGAVRLFYRDRWMRTVDDW